MSYLKLSTDGTNGVIFNTLAGLVLLAAVFYVLVIGGHFAPALLSPASLSRGPLMTAEPLAAGD